MRIAILFITALMCTTAIATNPASLSVLSDDETINITITGGSKKTSTTPGERLTLPPGHYSVSAKSDRFGRSRTERISLDPGQAAEIVLLFGFPDTGEWLQTPRYQTFEAQLSAPDDWAMLQDYTFTAEGLTLRHFIEDFPLQESHLREVRLLADLEIIDAEELRYWLSALPIMTDEQRTELISILTSSHAQEKSPSWPKDKRKISLAYHDAVARFAPGSAWAQTTLAKEQQCAGMLLAAEQSWQRALAIDEDNIHILNSYAWAIATTADDRYRDGKTAQQLLHQIIDKTTFPYLIDTYAAALAAQGKYTQAVHYQEKVLAHAMNKRDRESMQQRLALYRTQQGYIEKSPCGEPGS